jgi:hypothetical protein
LSRGPRSGKVFVKVDIQSELLQQRGQISPAGIVVQLHLPAFDSLGEVRYPIIGRLLGILDGRVVVGEDGDVFDMGGQGPCGSQQKSRASCQNRHGSVLHLLCFVS